MSREITRESLLDFGMCLTLEPESFIFPMIKVISEPLKEGDGMGSLKIAVTRMKNRDDLCLVLPDGALIYLSPKSIEDLENFEKMIVRWEPVF